MADCSRAGVIEIDFAYLACSVYGLLRTELLIRRKYLLAGESFEEGYRLRLRSMWGLSGARGESGSLPAAGACGGAVELRRRTMDDVLLRRASSRAAASGA